ncbi:hypothetical protein [Waddlia chondrophila]|uniref:Conserved putative membrane protein n=1 Tax=Waddlia chondrophila (strain ATCC VR-1470 / WSU 86-1044) TaxID=716544 RepID=D6YVT7_WADCW|nr:hypothetical protein [Waddlia chondrophila]ADI38248.1 conserved putative membrane protein [Waddlia chondrophila WSU 86-1044]
MELILAKILGIYFIAVSLALIFNPERIKRIYSEMLKSESLMFFGGIVAIFLGAWIVSVHNVWVLDWPVIITVVGWISLIKGVGLISCSDFASRLEFIYERSSEFFRFFGVIWGIIGLVLLYYGTF